MWRGYQPRTSGEITLVPREFSFVGGGFPHSGPWGYLQHIPMFWYGPGFVRPGVYRRPATLADVAPTIARLIGFPFRAPDGHALPGVLSPAASRPRLVVTVVWDAGGRDVLGTWPRSWPTLRRLIPRGAWFEQATVGSSPSVTAPDHATLGTGAFPRHHGVIDNRFRQHGRIRMAWYGGPYVLRVPTLADLYDRARGNRPVIGAVGTSIWHLGMIGHGSSWPGGDRDAAVMHAGGGSAGPWDIPAVDRPFFTFPTYANSVPGFAVDVRRADRSDGLLDGRWWGTSIQSLDNGFDTPARLPWETRLLGEMIAREGFGRDAVPDLLYVNYKLIDHIEHSFDMNSIEMRETLKVQDRVLGELIRILNREVGNGRWAMVMVADHGSTPDPRVSGGFPISAFRLLDDLRRAFDDADGTSAIADVEPTAVYLNRRELRQEGHTVRDVARFLSTYTERDNGGTGGVPVFAAAFPSAYLPRLAVGRSGG
jgi:hypothetical protein